MVKFGLLFTTGGLKTQSRLAEMRLFGPYPTISWHGCYFHGPCQTLVCLLPGDFLDPDVLVFVLDNNFGIGTHNNGARPNGVGYLSAGNGWFFLGPG